MCVVVACVVLLSHARLGGGHDRRSQRSMLSIRSANVGASKRTLLGDFEDLLRETHDAIPPEGSFVLFRCVGNDLPPRHTVDQTMGNVRFILDNEPEHAGLTKIWVINRITDENARRSVEALLHEYQQLFVVIPFDVQAYSRRRLNFVHHWPQSKIFNSVNAADDYVADIVHNRTFHGPDGRQNAEYVKLYHR